MALIDDFNLAANNSDFLYRVQMALVSTALAVQSEATSTANHAARSAYAQRVLADPSGFARVMAPGFTVDASTTAASTDAQLESRASAIFNAYALQT
jgi:hypothetical protein